ncbi:arylsulfatase [Exophiala viscosa]|uniref:Arylsulfatase n=1 Tax=Exophiala viscosa TaxID=2486360 RepID=A0AAN6E300_9EURO|nr:arylsulfatase [Exophiala viscosa]
MLTLLLWLLAALMGARTTATSDQEILNSIAHQAKTSKYNIVFVLTDDQDAELGSLDHMPFVAKHLLARGTNYKRHYATTAVCCPSRATIWTGLTAHRHNITDVNPPWGGYPKFAALGHNENYVPVWLQEAGIGMYYTGKLFNVHTVSNYDSPYPGGFTGTDFLLDPYTYNYMNSTFQSGTDKPVSYEGHYSTDVVAEKGFALLDQAVESQQQFFLTIAPIAPHCNIYMNGSVLAENHTFEFTAPIAAERHKHLFSDVKTPRSENFNPDEPSGVSWVRQLPKINDTVIEYLDDFYQARLQALQAVDELVDGLFQRLESYELLNNTYVIYSSDNGYHIANHRLLAGKSTSFEEDIHVPLIIRGPGVPENHSTNLVTTHTDLAPTFFNLLDVPLRPEFDGKPIPVTQSGLETALREKHEHVNVEYWGFAGAEGIYSYEPSLIENNTFKALRIISEDYDLYYSVWCSNEHELYDMRTDPGQMHNLLFEEEVLSPTNPSFLLGVPVQKIVARLDALLFVTKSCAKESCVRPWSSLHPYGNVSTLEDALSPLYDHFYEVEQRRVVFDRCENGYIIDAEGPQFERDGIMYRDGLPWDTWV